MGNNSTKLGSESPIFRTGKKSPFIKFKTDDISLGNNFQLDAVSIQTGARSWDWKTYKVYTEGNTSIPGYPQFKNLGDLVNFFGAENIEITVELYYTAQTPRADCNRDWSIYRIYVPKGWFTDAFSTSVYSSGGGEVRRVTQNWKVIYNKGIAKDFLVDGFFAFATSCGNSGCGCSCYDGCKWAADLSVRVNGEINVGKFCGIGSNFDSEFCKAFCDDPTLDNQLVCYDNALEYCFRANRNGNIPMLDEEGQCQKFFVAYQNNSQNSSVSRLSEKLRKLCDDEGITPGNYLSEGPNYINLCACHLDYEPYENIYDTYYNQLKQKIPELSLSNQSNVRCIFPGCGEIAKFRPDEMRGAAICPSAKCIIGATINNTGSIEGNISVNQSAECLNTISGGSGTGGGSGGGGSESGGNDSGGGGITPKPECDNDSDCNSGEFCDDGYCKGKVEQGPNVVAIGVGVGLAILLLIILGVVAFLFLRKKKPATQLP